MRLEIYSLGDSREGGGGSERGNRDMAVVAGETAAGRSSRGAARQGDGRRRLDGTDGKGVVVELAGNLPWD